MVFRTVAGGGTPPELAGEDACATSIFKTRPEAAAAFCLIAAAAAALVLSGCSTFGPPKRGWADAKIAAQPCLEPLHGHDTRERTAGALRLVTMDLGRYKSVQERPNQESNLVLAVAISGGGER